MIRSYYKISVRKNWFQDSRQQLLEIVHPPWIQQIMTLIIWVLLNHNQNQMHMDLIGFKIICLKISLWTAEYKEYNDCWKEQL